MLRGDHKLKNCFSINLDIGRARAHILACRLLVSNAYHSAITAARSNKHVSNDFVEAKFQI